ncbi:hypothetical protein GQ53DRAFT_775997 [Thozetella sp. PMI_491]|nr:hypothetical protein GQ53DRAFT_775997 [Thozetella sp. PMI_491]
MFLLAATALAANEINKPSIQPAFNESIMEPIMRQNMYPTQSRWEFWGEGWIPKTCKDFALQNGLNPWDYEIFNVFYTDCSEPWIMCRHKGAPASVIDMIDIFGRMPVHMRQYVAHLTAVPWLNDGTIAATDSANIVVRGFNVNITVLSHEISHNLDKRALNQFLEGHSRFSETGIWRDNINADAVVVTPYAATSWIENYAATGVIGVYDKLVPGGIGPIQPNWSQIFHGYATYQAFLGDTIIPGGTCNVKLDNSPPVWMYDSSMTYFCLLRTGMI